jgi:hypothetical protein
VTERESNDSGRMDWEERSGYEVSSKLGERIRAHKRILAPLAFGSGAVSSACRKKSEELAELWPHRRQAAEA